VTSIEHLGTDDPKRADGHITLYSYGNDLCAIDIVPKGGHVTVAMKKLLIIALEEFAREKDLPGLDTKIESTNKGLSGSDTFFIKVGVKNADLQSTLTHLLQYLKQSRVLKNPIVVDLRSYNIKR